MSQPNPPATDHALRTFSARVFLLRLASWADIAKAHPENVMAPIKLGTAARLLEDRGHRVTLVDTETGVYRRDEVVNMLRRERPDVVVVHGITTALPNLLRFGRTARELLPDALVVASGQHATARPQDFFFQGSPFDVATQVEYEEPLADLVEAHVRGAPLQSVAGLALPEPAGGFTRTPPRPLRDDLDTLPFPKHELFMREEYTVFHPTDVRGPRRWGFVMTSRGCPYPCLYCSPTLRNSYGRKMRFRSAENVTDELAYLARLGATVVHMKDDIFTIDRERTLALCDAIQRRGLRLSWTCQTRADCVDLELLKAMRAAGCCTVSYGIESGSPRILEVLRKRESVEDSLNAAAWTRAAGLHLVTFYLLGNPTETLSDMEMTLALAKRIDPDLLQVGFFTPYPGSPFYEEQYREQGESLDPDDLSHYNRVQVNFSAVPTDELMRFQRRFYREIILSPRFAARFARNRLRGLPANLGAEMRFFRLSAKFLLKSLTPGRKAAAVPS